MLLKPGIRYCYICDAGECLFQEKALPRTPSPKPFWRFLLAGAGVTPAAKKRKAHKETGRGLLQKSRLIGKYVGECLFEGKALPRAPSPKPFWRFFVSSRRCTPAAKKRKAHKHKKRGERTFAEVLSPHPSFKNFKASDRWRKAFNSQRKCYLPSHRTEPRRHGTSCVEPGLPDTAVQNPVSPCS